jgi:hypothetical protein
MTKHRKFDMHVDASLLNFRFKDPIYVEVRYGIWADGRVDVYDIVASPSTLRNINDMPLFLRQCEDAAKHNAEMQLQTT